MKKNKNFRQFQKYFLLTAFGLNTPLRNKMRKQLGSRNADRHVQEIIHLFLLPISFSHPSVYIKWLGNSLIDAPQVANTAQSVHEKCGQSTWLTGITTLPTVLQAFQLLIDDVVDKAAKAEGGSKTDKSNLAAAILLLQTSGSLDIVKIVQSKIYANKDSSVAIADSCGMFLKNYGGRDAQEWSVTRVAKGSVEIIGSVKGLKTRYTAQWQRTVDAEDDESWYLRANEIIPTTTGKTIVSGLPLGVEMFFRYRLIVKGEAGDWSNVISLHIS